MMPSLSNGFLAPYGFVIQDPRVGATEDMMIPCLPALAPIATPVPFGISFLHPIPTSAQPKETLHPSAARETVARAPLQKKPSSKTTNRQSVHSVAVQPRVIMMFYFSLSLFIRPIVSKIGSSTACGKHWKFWEGAKVDLIFSLLATFFIYHCKNA